MGGSAPPLGGEIRGEIRAWYIYIPVTPVSQLSPAAAVRWFSQSESAEAVAGQQGPQAPPHTPPSYRNSKKKKRERDGLD